MAVSISKPDGQFYNNNRVRNRKYLNGNENAPLQKVKRQSLHLITLG